MFSIIPNCSENQSEIHLLSYNMSEEKKSFSFNQAQYASAVDHLKTKP
jgi:hypothetical protein